MQLDVNNVILLWFCMFFLVFGVQRVLTGSTVPAVSVGVSV